MFNYIGVLLSIVLMAIGVYYQHKTYIITKDTNSKGKTEKPEKQKTSEMIFAVSFKRIRK